MKKDSCTPINPKKYSCYGLKKIHTRNLSSFGNETKFLRLENFHEVFTKFSNGPSLTWTLFREEIRTDHYYGTNRAVSGKIRIPKSWKFLLVESEMRENFPVESGILGFGIWNMALGIRNPTNDWNPGSKFHWPRIRNPVPGVRNPRCWIQNPRLAWIPFHGAKLRSVIYKLLHATFTICAVPCCYTRSRSSLWTVCSILHSAKYHLQEVKNRKINRQPQEVIGSNPVED